MSLSPNVRRAFERWVRASTWYTGHPLDERRFYRFVWAVLEFSRRRPSERELQAEIVAFWKGRFDPDQLIYKARAYASLYQTLIEFARARKRVFADSD